MELSRTDLTKSEIYVLYPSPEKKKNARFGYSVEALSLATLIQSVNTRLKYYDFSLSEYGDPDHPGYSRISQAFPRIVFVYVDSVPLHRSSNVDNATRLTEQIKKESPDTIIIACGPWCMLTHEEFPFADITFLNEPEYDVLRIMNGNPNDSVVSRTPLLLNDLSQLPIPDRNLLPIGKYDDVPTEINKSAVIQTTRGCRNGCLFCPRQAWNLRRIRHRPTESIIEEIDLLRKSGVRNVWIDDDNMGSDQAWSIELFSAIASVNGDHMIQFYISSDVNVSKNFFIEAKKAGVRIVSFGIESGSDQILRSIKKPSNTKLLRTAINNANAVGLFTVGNFIIGFPGESLDDIALTKKLLLDLPIDEANIKILSYVRGAPFWSDAVEKNCSLSQKACFFSCSETGTSNFSFEKLAEIQQEFYGAFRNSASRAARLKAKIQLFGYPYAL